jgi:hypothetical protein
MAIVMKMKEYKKSGTGNLFGRLLVFVTAFSFAALAVFLIAMSLKIDWIIVSVFESGKSMQQIHNTTVSDSHAPVRAKNILLPPVYANKGDHNIEVMKLVLETEEINSRLQQLNLNIVNYGNTSLKALQLYKEDVLLTEVTVMGKDVKFENLWTRMKDGENEFKITASVGHDAKGGDIIKVSINSRDDIMVLDDDNVSLGIQSDFPIFGRKVTLVGEKIRF